MRSAIGKELGIDGCRLLNTW